MLKSLTKVHCKISQKTRQLSLKKLNLSVKRRKTPAQNCQLVDKQEIMIFDIGYPINPVQEYAQYPRVHNTGGNCKYSKAANNGYGAYEEPALDPNMLDFDRLDINDPMEQYDQRLIPAVRTNRRHKCRGCALPFNYTTITIFSPDEINPTYCIGCERLFGSMSNFQVHQRLHHSTNRIKNNPVFETHFLNDTSMHPHYECAPSYDNQQAVFHLLCSPNYYKRFVNKYGDAKYVLLDVQPVIQDKLQHFFGCNGCRQFIEHERSPIYFDTVNIAGKYDMATHKEVLVFLSYNMTCMETGLQGCWSPTGKEFFSLQLELRTPVLLGGRGFLDNFKVSLVGIDSLLDMFDAQDVRKWLKAVKEHQGYYPPR